ncbi:hypothetical protein ALC56_10352, partial [Trachymyrmex septentrionalis]
RSLSWSRGYARGGCSLVGPWRGRDVDVERVEWEWGFLKQSRKVIDIMQIN